MISCSHWGMFEDIQRIIVVPAGFKLDERDHAEWFRPDGIIRMVKL